MLKWEFEILEDIKVLRINVTGFIDKEGFIDLALSGFSKGAELKYNMLWDFRQTKLKADLGAIYFTQKFEGIKNTIHSQLKIVGVVPEEDFNDWKFVETVYRNAGMVGYAFVDEVEAMAWLTS